MAAGAGCGVASSWGAEWPAADSASDWMAPVAFCWLTNWATIGSPPAPRAAVMAACQRASLLPLDSQPSITMPGQPQTQMPDMIKPRVMMLVKPTSRTMPRPW